MIFTAEEIARSNQVFAEETEMAKRMRAVGIFGAGQAGQWMHSFLTTRNIVVVAFVDNSASLRGKEYRGIPILSPEEYRRRYSDHILVISVGDGHRTAIIQQCERLGLATVLHYNAMAITRIGCFSEPKRAEEIETNPDALAALGIWEDDESREKYLAFLKIHALREYNLFRSAEEGQYFSSRYMPSRFLDNVVDVGAYTGDTLEQFFAVTGGKFTAYYAFEPDPDIFTVLRSSPFARDPRVFLYPNALGATKCVMKMTRFAVSSTSFSKDGDIEVQVLPLVDVLEDKPVSLIKMDIEGAEPEALAGMEDVIRTWRPALAISLYHQVSHYWEIPLWIARLDLNYSLRIGCHSNTYNEVICYAIPRNGGAMGGEG